MLKKNSCMRLHSATSLGVLSNGFSQFTKQVYSCVVL